MADDRPAPSYVCLGADVLRRPLLSYAAISNELSRLARLRGGEVPAQHWPGFEQGRGSMHVPGWRLGMVQIAPEQRYVLVYWLEIEGQPVSRGSIAAQRLFQELELVRKQRELHGIPVALGLDPSFPLNGMVRGLFGADPIDIQNSLQTTCAEADRLMQGLLRGES